MQSSVRRLFSLACTTLFSFFTVAANADLQSECFSKTDYPFEGCRALVSRVQLPDVYLKQYVYADPSTNPKFSGGLKMQYRPPSRLIDLEGLSDGLAISSNFKLGDFLRTENGRYGVFSTGTLERLERIWSANGSPLVINSGYRSPGHNTDTSGSSKWSRHMYGDGVDIQALSTPLKKSLKALCEKNEAAFVLLYKTHIHCDWRKDTLDTHFYDDGDFVLNEKLNFFPRNEFLIRWKPELRIIGLDTFFGIAYLMEAEMEDPEGEGELFVEWSINYPDGTVYAYEGMSVVLEPQLAGTYQVHAVIGGLYELNKEIVVTEVQLQNGK